ncbi:MAG: class II aldolase/adducin family protein [Rhodospirillales bacterium]|nr:class II aldolase/adducin family protein [Rhodospirillales bacterium]
MATTETDGAMTAALKNDLQDLAKACRILELNGHSDRIWGHVAMRDPEGRGFWIKRHAISLGEVYDENDFLLFSFEGEMLAGYGRHHSEWPIHSEIFLLRPDINYTCHGHPFYGSIFSAISDPLHLVRGDTPRPEPRYEGSSLLVVTKERGKEVAEALGDAMAVFMRNHGVVFCGASIGGLIKQGIDLETACAQTLAVSGSGLAWSWAGAAEQAQKSTGRTRFSENDPCWDHYCRILRRAEAGGDPRLSTGPVENR